MNPFSLLRKQIKQSWGDTGPLGVTTTPLRGGGVLLKSRINTHSPRKPICAVISHLENKYELGNALALGARLQMVFKGDEMPALHIYAAQNDVRVIQRTIVPQLKHTTNTGIVTFGALATHHISREHHYRPFGTPLYLSDIYEPEELPVFKNDHPGRHLVTGVGLRAAGYSKLAYAIKDTCPERTRALIIRGKEINTGAVARLGYGLGREQGGMCLDRGILPKHIEVGITDDIYTEVMKYLTPTDIIIAANDSVAMAQLDRLVKLGDDTKTPIISHNLSGVVNGSVLGYGESASITGPHLANAMIRNIIDGESLGDMPVLTLKAADTVRFNRFKIKSQGLQVDAKYLRAMHMVDASWE